MHETLRHAWRTVLSAREEVSGILLLLLGACMGGSLGIASAFLHASDAIPFAIADTSPPVPTVVIEAAPNGRYEGRLTGEARVLLGEDMVAQGSGAFVGTMRGSLPVTVEVPVPAGMKYVASKAGKKYYDVTSAMGNRLLPKNRVYFPDRASAEAAGFKP